MHSFSGNESGAANPMTDPLGFIRQLWGSMQVPGMVAPPMSVDELDKKIQDLKTVESWLTVNMNMLRGTIQTLEVQRATMAALQSIGESFAQHAEQARQSANQFTEAARNSDESAKTSSWPSWPMPDFSQRDAAEAAEPDQQPESSAQSATDSLDQTDTDKAEQGSTASQSASEQPTGSTGSFANPAAWWNLLQDQFKQAVSQAVQSEQPAASAKTADMAKANQAEKRHTAPTKTSRSSAGKTAGRTATGNTAKASVKPAGKPSGKSTASRAASASGSSETRSKTSKRSAKRIKP